MIRRTIIRSGSLFKTFFVWLVFSLFMAPVVQAQEYAPGQENLAHRKEFQDMKFGMFIHWGVFSELGDGEWVMNNRGVTVQEYARLKDFFNPISFDAKKWVEAAKSAGMKYITLITRHHDGFSNWDTRQSDWKITNTPYGKDVVKQIAAECHRQGIQLFLYYSLLDWTREDYPHETGKTGQRSGRAGHGNYASYLQFMKNQLTELLTNYGEIAGIWFDGHWDQTAPEGAADRSSRIDWHYPEIYGLIHKLQPKCLIGNNHHMQPFDGEDFQMFEKDLPGQNRSGLSFQSPSRELPLETCETMNDSWGFNITDGNYKTSRQLIQYLVNAAGRNANFLLNIGPMPNGIIQPEFIDTLKKIGAWMREYGETIYGTRGNRIAPQDWGVVTARDNKLFIHILHKPGQQNFIFVPGVNGKIIRSVLFSDKSQVKIKQQPEGVFVFLDGLEGDEVDRVVELDIK